MFDVLLYVLGILIILVGLAVSIGLHEIGHLVPAKLFGVKVTQYMIGFGRTIWSRRRGETEYGVKMIPLGGYISMTGMFPPAKPGEAPRESTTGFLNSVVQEGAPRRGVAGMVDEARLASAETIEAGEDSRTFYRLPAWKRIIIMLGGPFMNLVLAFVFFAIVLCGFGVPQNSTTLGSVNECLKSASQSGETACSANDPEAPAAAAGLRPGDEILSIDGTAVRDWNAFRDTVSASPGRTLSIEIRRDGETRQLSLTPVTNTRVVTDANGQTVKNSDGSAKTEQVGMVGATPASELVQQSITEVPGFVGDNVGRVVGVVVGLPQRMVDVWNAAFGPEQRDPNGPMSVVGVGRLAGEIVSTDAPVAAKAQVMFGLLGSLNVALFVFNLVPLMPLDGGHVAGAIYEAIKRGIARLRRKPDPGPVDTAKMVPITFGVVIMLGAMTVLLVYADLVKPISFFG
ncbi:MULTISPECIES: site-2 protease family protein [unclassified Leucobacter]|uniref:M50 family metallopeptidase n=1 Tax=unclassified Leucobacter TaxID=2621730 RepID=UPI0018EE22EE|nr:MULTISPECIES: site-2 protease family protein [unclassified Leucobacter]